MKRSLTPFILILIFIVLPTFFMWYVSLHTRINMSNEFYSHYILGGFSIDTPKRATKAATDGIQVVFKYDQPPSENDKMGQKLNSLHMKVVDGYISSYLHYLDR